MKNSTAYPVIKRIIIFCLSYFLLLFFSYSKAYGVSSPEEQTTIGKMVFDGKASQIFQPNSSKLHHSESLEQIVITIKEQKGIQNLVIVLVCLPGKDEEGNIIDLGPLRFQVLKDYLTSKAPNIPIEGKGQSIELPEGKDLSKLPFPVSLDKLTIGANVDSTVYSPTPAPLPEIMEYEEKDSWKTELYRRYRAVDQDLRDYCQFVYAPYNENAIQYHFSSKSSYKRGEEEEFQEAALRWLQYIRTMHLREMSPNRSSVNSSLYVDLQQLKALLGHSKELHDIANEIKKREPKVDGKDPKPYLFSDVDLQYLIAKHHRGLALCERGAQYADKGEKVISELRTLDELGACYTSYVYLIAMDLDDAILILKDEREETLESLKNLINYIRSNLNIHKIALIDDYPICIPTPPQKELIQKMKWAFKLLKGETNKILERCPVQRLQLNQSWEEIRREPPGILIPRKAEKAR